MVRYFFALLAPIVIFPLIPFFGRLLAQWIADRPTVPDLAWRLETARRVHRTRACTVGTCRCLERGMTLVEVMVAVPIIMIGLVALMCVIPYAAQNIQTGNTVSTATFLVNQRLDQVKRVADSLDPAYPGYRMVTDAMGCIGVVSPDPLAAMVGTESLVDYSRTTTIVTDADVCPMKTVTVTVSYRGKLQSTATLAVAPR